MSNSTEMSRCSACKKDKPIVDFRLKRDGTSRNKTCVPCNDRTKQANRDRRGAEKENSGAGDVDEPDQEAFGADLGVLPLSAFIDALVEQGDSVELEARVDIASISGARRDRADELARLIWKERSYRFMCVHCLVWISRTCANILHLKKLSQQI
jgi:hypothetical protein